MPPFASAELARDSPLDELAFRHSLSSVSISSLASTPRPSSLPILDAFPLPLNTDYGSSPDSSSPSSHAGTPPPPAPAPVDASPILHNTPGAAPRTMDSYQYPGPRALGRPAGTPAEPPAEPPTQPPTQLRVGPPVEPPVEPEVARRETAGYETAGHEAPGYAAPGGETWRERAAPKSLGRSALHDDDSLGRESPRPAPPDVRFARHARESSTDTILPAPDQAVLASPLSRTQKRYQRYGHSYSGSQGHASPGTSPKRPGASPARAAPPALGPTWRGLATHSAPTSAASAVEPGFAAAMAHAPALSPAAHALRAAETPPAAAHRHARAPSQPAFRAAQTPGLHAHAFAFPRAPAPAPAPATPNSGTAATADAAADTASASPRGLALPPLLLPPTHGVSQSWDVGAGARVRIPTLASAAQHLREGSAALAVDSRLTLEHWAAAAARFGSAAGNLLLELGWAERWIPWTIISGLELPVRMHAVDLSELKCGVTPCMGRVADALHSYGVRLQVRQQEAAALRAFELAESLGSTEAAFSAAHLCMKGGRQVKKDVVKARSLLRRVNDI